MGTIKISTRAGVDKKWPSGSLPARQMECWQARRTAVSRMLELTPHQKLQHKHNKLFHFIDFAQILFHFAANRYKLPIKVANREN
jgi:hypothetical protein